MMEESGFEMNLHGTRSDANGEELPERRAAIYARTSTESQRLGYSIDEQTRQCVDRCQRLDWTITFVYKDEAKSGKDTDRPMFQRMLANAERGLFDVVVFWKLDRFSRSIMHAVQLEKQFQDWGVALHSVTEQLDTTTAAGQFNFRNLANTAEFERDMISQRTSMGLAARALDGKWPSGKPPLGYNAGGDGRLQIDDGEAEVVRWVFGRYTEIKSMAKVAEELNESERANTLKEWTPAAVSEILRNEIYAGKYRVGDTERHEPEYQLISEDLFQDATKIRKRFRSSDQQKRESMGVQRRTARVDRILDQYREWLGD